MGGVGGLCADGRRLCFQRDHALTPTHPFHSKRDKARAQLQLVFGKVIAARRASGAVEDDMLQVFMDSEYKDGERGWGWGRSLS